MRNNDIQFLVEKNWPSRSRDNSWAISGPMDLKGKKFYFCKYLVFSNVLILRLLETVQMS